MPQPNFIQYEFVNSTIFNNAFELATQGYQESLANDVFFIPGLINQGSLAFSFNGNLTVTLTATNSGVSAFKTLFQTGTISGAFGTANGSTTNVYNVDLTSLVPVSGSQIVYIIAQFTQIQQLSTTILGPPSGHPDYSPNFVPTSGYTELVNSITITATTAIPDNNVTLELARLTLTAGQTVVTAVDTTHQVQARVNALFVTMAGDVTGPSNNNIISNLQGKPVSASSPTVNYVLTWNGVNWVPAAIPPPVGLPGASHLVGGSSGTLDVVATSDSLYLRNISNNGITIVNNFSGTCVVVGSQTGSQLNGRDQSAAFGINTFFHMYAIGAAGQTPGLIVSLTAPPTGPTLPTNYTSWTYLGTFLTDGSGKVVSAYLNGNRINYSVQVSEFEGAGEATSATAISLESSVPLIAQSSILSIFVNSNSTGANELVFIGPDGRCSWWISHFQPSVSALQSAVIELPMTHNNPQEMWYFVTRDGGGSGVLYSVRVMGYTVPNNAS